MANEFQVSNVISTEGLKFLYHKNVMAGPDNLANRTHEADWSQWDDLQIGTSVRIPVPFYFDNLDEFDNVQTVQSDRKDKTIELKIEKHFYKKIGITTEDVTFRAPQFMQNTVKSVMEVFGRGIEQFVFRKMYSGTYNYVALGGNPSSKADLAKINTAFIKMLADAGERKVVLTTAANESIVSIEGFTKANERGTDITINTGLAGSYYGMDMYTSTLLDGIADEVKASVTATTFTDGTLKVSVKKDQDSKLVVLTGAVAGEIIKKYTIVKIGNGSIVAAADAVADSSGDIQVLVERVGYDLTVGAEATIPAGIGYNFAFTPDTFLLVQVSPEVALGAADTSYALEPQSGANIRVTVEWSNSNLATNAVFDTFVGGRVGQAERSYRV